MTLSIVPDTNVIISAVLFGGKPAAVFTKIISGEIEAVTSPSLLTELLEILRKKFKYPENELRIIEEKIKEEFVIVYPKMTINVLTDEPDNRVLEAAVEGNCNLIITGDKELLAQKVYKNIKILTPEEFLRTLA